MAYSRRRMHRGKVLKFGSSPSFQFQASSFHSTSPLPFTSPNAYNPGHVESCVGLVNAWRQKERKSDEENRNAGYHVNAGRGIRAD